MSAAPITRRKRRAARGVVATVFLSSALVVLPATDDALAWRRSLPVLRSTPENVVWGGFPIDRPAVMTIAPGDTIRIDTISGSGGTNPDITPEAYFEPFGVKPDEILPDLKSFWASLPGRERYGPHVLTGPLYIEGAEPGDTLQIEVLDLDTRVPYGVNSTGPTGGPFSPTYPGSRPGDLPLDIPATIPPEAPGGVLPDVRQHVYRTGRSRGKEVAFFNEDIELPLQPFMGVMGVAPEAGKFVGRTEDEAPPASGVQGSGPPGPFGGNMDTHDLTVGSTLYLPVFHQGAQFFVGDAHSLQGDGEVSGTAIEHSLSGTFRFTLHKGRTIDGPWAEDADYWIMMGIDWDLDRALKFATKEVVDFLVEQKGFTVSKAFSFASIAVDFHNAEVVDGTQVVVGKIPKKPFEGKGPARR